MLDHQRSLQSRLGYDFAAMSDRERVQFIKDMQQAAVAELFEALDEVSWKPWATGEPRIMTHALMRELSDAFQFIMNMWLAATPGATPDQISSMMLATLVAKLQVNHERVGSGYDGVSTKCPKCKRALDEPKADAPEKSCYMPMPDPNNDPDFWYGYCVDVGQYTVPRS